MQSIQTGATLRNLLFGFTCFCVLALISPMTITAADDPAEPKAIGTPEENLAAQLGVRFLAGSSTKLILERDGRQYELDLTTQQVHELPPAAQQESAAAAAAQPLAPAALQVRPRKGTIPTIRDGNTTGQAMTLFSRFQQAALLRSTR